MLGTLIDGLVGARVLGDPGVPVRGVQSDSRAIEPGDVYVAVRGMRADGHAFVPAAIERGAAAVVVEHPLDVAVPQVIVADGAAALGVLVARSLGDPARAMTLIGITGTNGKTTTTYLVEAILAAAGARPGVIGTVEYRWRGPGGERITRDAPFTTPTPQVLHETFAAMRDAGTTHVVMEVSSAALVMERLAGVAFTVGAFSNLTQDHLDVHPSMEAYRDAKRLLFSRYLVGAPHAGTAVVNVDDAEGDGMAAGGPGRALRVSAEGRPSDVRVVAHESTVRGITARIATARGELAIAAPPLIGHYNVANLALAVGIAEALAIPHEAIARGIAGLPGVPGRVERVPNGADLDIFVDYAHTPDALHNVLSALRPLTRRRLICVFGCGGDRDPTKRPKMGAEVAALADLAVVTSDNPRTEDPRAIIEQILAGMPRPFAVDADRARAIRAAISEAVPGDVVVIAGKGHEDYQILGTTKHHFDDREQAAAAVAEREGPTVAELATDAGATLTATGGGAQAQIHRVVIDSRIAAPGDLYVAVRGEAHDGHAFCEAAVAAGARAVMVEHPVPVDAPSIVVGDSRVALGEMARAHRRRWRGALVAITGSSGKTTTKELTRAALALAGPTYALESSMNNETGVPLNLLALRGFHGFAVVEMGMRGLGQIEYLTRIAEPDVAVVINAGTAHIELLGSTDAIARAKSEIWLGLRDGGTIVRPLDDDRLAAYARMHRPSARHLTFGERGADVALVGYRPIDTPSAGEGRPSASAAGVELELDILGNRHGVTLGMLGKHVAIDACAAMAAAIAAGAPVELALRGLAHARPPSLRGELAQVHGRTIIVDCYNANPASMAAALRTLAERAQGHGALAVVGDMLELGDHAPEAHREVGELARELGLGVIALGQQAPVVVAAAGGDAEVVATPGEAAARAIARTRPGDWMLLKASRGMRLERVLTAIRQVT
ncbi:MAG TPA: UDP-N-acetylmuramoyl-L-alanyl-D-glutamate--2,6-diaminopimelate ligase [Kofleriaceae bacterium]|nr:UDP-N-acetylmuramoyl-L-alanyl-D-glutamate--2,6-diaminopimelate ligase [Kofleriaceae bacterium]